MYVGVYGMGLERTEGRRAGELCYYLPVACLDGWMDDDLMDVVSY